MLVDGFVSAANTGTSHEPSVQTSTPVQKTPQQLRCGITSGSLKRQINGKTCGFQQKKGLKSPIDSQP
jgi:hypothetical protein